MRRISAFILAAIAVFALAACGGAATSTAPAPAAEPTAAPAPAAEQLAAPAVTLGSLTINDPWVRPANPMAPAATPMPAATGSAMGGMDMPAAVNTGGYMVITNSAAETDYLVGASASDELCEAVELHTMVEENGVMMMRPVEKIEVPAGGEAVLKPGSFHVMFIGVKQELKPGDSVKVSLTFEKAGSVDVDAVVRPPQPMP